MNITHFIIMTGIYTLAALGLNILMGYLGRIALAEIALIGIGAYSYAILTVKSGWNTIIALVVSICLTGIIGGIFGFFASRIKGDSYLLVSISGFVIAQTTFLAWTDLTGGPFGILNIPSLFHSSMKELSLIVVILVVFALMVSWILDRTRCVLMWRAIRDDELAAAGLDINIPFLRTIASGLAGLYMSLSGIILVSYLTVVEPTAFSISLPLSLLLIVCLGGLGRWNGAFIGALLYVIIDESARHLNVPSEHVAQWQQIIFSAILLILIFVRPTGILGRYTLTEMK